MTEGQTTGGFDGTIPVTSLPAEIQSEGAIKNYVSDGKLDVGKALKGHAELNRAFHSRKMADLEAPTDDAGKRAVLAKLGHELPDSPDGYELPDDAKSRAALYHKAGLSKAQAKALAEAETESQTQAGGERKARMEQRRAEAERAMRTEWGDKYAENAELVKRGAEHFLKDDTLRELLSATGVIHHPDMQKLLYGVGRQLKEGTMHTGTGAVGGPQTVADAQKAVNAIMADENKRKLVMSQNDLLPGVKEAKQELTQAREHLAKLRVAERASGQGATGSQSQMQ